MKQFVKIRFSLFIFLFSFITYGDSQTFLNGNFEITTAGTDQINLGNAPFNGFMSNTIAYGSFGDMDIISSATYCGLAQSGLWYVAFTGTATDAITMQLSAPLVAGTNYTISFWDRGCWGSFATTSPAVQLGVSTVAGATGTAVYLAPMPLNGTWVQRTATFVAPVSGAYISVLLPAGGLGDWTQVDNFTFVVAAGTPPVSNFTASTTTICAGSCIAFTDASTNTPTSWNWTFAGGTPATSTTQNPSSVCYATAGTYAVTLTVSNASGSDTHTQTSYITVNPIDAATFNYSALSYCQSGVNPTPTITGTPGGTFSSTGGLSINAATGAINLLSSTLGTYTVTYSTSGACPATSTAAVTISSVPLATFNYAGPYCQSAADPSPTLGAGAALGTFTSTAGLIINAATGIVDLSLSTAGTYTVTNSVAASGSCPATSASATITINAVPVPVITGIAAICAGASTTLNASGGTTYSWSSGSVVAATTVSPGTTTTYTVTANNGGCTATATQTITVSIAPIATFNYSGPYCQSAVDPSPTLGAGASLGTFTSTAGLIINSATGVVDLSLSTAGTYTVTNSVPASGSCPATSATATITINAVPVPIITGITAICTGASTTLTASGGTTYSWSTGSVVATASVSPITTTTYTVTANNGGCTATATQTVTVTASPTATFNYAGPYCQNAVDPSPTLGAGAALGTFTSTAGLIINSATGVVDLSLSAAGTYTVTNSVAASGSCPATSATATITIKAVPVPVITGITTICSGASTALTVSGGTTYSWSTGSTSAVLNISPATTTTYTVTANNGGCTATSTQIVTVNPPVTSNATVTICAGQSYTLPSGTVVGNPGTYTDTISAAGGCDSIITTNLIVNSASANAGIDTIIAYGSSTVLTASGGVTYSWSPSTGLSCTNCVSPTAAPLQTTSYFVTTTNSNGCTATDMVTVIVELPPCEGSSVDLKTLIPNAFSPNEDGINEQLCIPANPCIAKLTLVIYDRWGEKVYEGTSIDQCWDGVYRGKKLDSAVFAYYFSVTFVDGKSGTGKGNISLIK
jgi:gliding motility-associated-like protein